MDCDLDWSYYRSLVDGGCSRQIAEEDVSWSEGIQEGRGYSRQDFWNGGDTEECEVGQEREETRDAEE